MIRLTSIKDRAVENLGVGSLVLFRHGGKWLPCLSVKHEGVAKLLALKFAPDPGSAPSPFLLQDNPAEPLEQRCLLLGPAEFYLPDLQSLAQTSTAYGRLVLDSHGAAITGRFSRKSDVMPQEHCWRVSADDAVQRISIDRTAPCAGAWEVGVLNTIGVFERLLRFPYDKEKTAS
jgi:hypothetical protein